MARAIFCVTGLMACFAAALPALSQAGHPLRGSWSGDWGPSPEHRNRVLLHLDWDGKEITGTINPGPNAAPITRAELDVTNWMVVFEAQVTDRSGNTLYYVIEGRIENLDSWTNRRLVGTWRHQSASGDFMVVMN